MSGVIAMSVPQKIYYESWLRWLPPFTIATVLWRLSWNVPGGQSKKTVHSSSLQIKNVISADGLCVCVFTVQTKCSVEMLEWNKHKSTAIINKKHWHLASQWGLSSALPNSGCCSEMLQNIYDVFGQKIEYVIIKVRSSSRRFRLFLYREVDRCDFMTSKCFIKKQF